MLLYGGATLRDPAIARMGGQELTLTDLVVFQQLWLRRTSLFFVVSPAACEVAAVSAFGR